MEERTSHQEITAQMEEYHSEVLVIVPHVTFDTPATWPIAAEHHEHLEEVPAQASGVREGFLEEVPAKL